MDALKWDTVKGAVQVALVMSSASFTNSGVCEVLVRNVDVLGPGEYRSIRDFGGGRP